MRTYGVICVATSYMAFIGHAASPEDACIRATKDAGAWGTLGPFQRSMSGPPKDSEFDWLELSVFDVTGLLDPVPGVPIKDASAMAAMTDDTHIAQFIARQY